MPDSDLSDLAWTTAYRILMTIDTRGRVVYGAQTTIDVFPLFKDLLIEGKSVPGSFLDSIAHALCGSEAWRSEARWRFCCGLLRDSGNPNCQKREQEQEKGGHSVCHRRNFLSFGFSTPFGDVNSSCGGVASSGYLRNGVVTDTGEFARPPASTELC